MLKLSPATEYKEGFSIRDWAGGRLVNCFAEFDDREKREQAAALLIPGTTSWGTAGSGPIRGFHKLGSTLYCVSAGQLYSVSSAGVATALGVIAGNGPVRMADNGTQLCIVGGTTGYVWNGTTLSTPLSYSVSDVAYVDGYILWAVANSDQFFISALDDATTYDAADIAVVEGHSDNLVGIEVSHREVLMFGTETLEIYYNNGNADFPFGRQGNAFVERGCFDRNSIVGMDNSVFFVGDDRIAYVLDGYSPVRISTHDIEHYLASATFANGFTYTFKGHKFYCLTLDDITLCFDAATRRWHQRKSYSRDTWRVNAAIDVYGATYFGDDVSGVIFSVSDAVFTENGDPILMDIILPTIEIEQERKTMYAFKAVFEMGVGNGSVTDPQVMLRYSNDNGHNWSNEMWRSLGKVGEHTNQAVWRTLGQFRQRQMWLRVSDAVKRVAISYYADIR